MIKNEFEVFNDCVKLYQSLNWVTLPIKKNAKMPYIKGWQSKTPADNAELATLFRDTDNIGILTGHVSGIVVIDVDVKRVDGMKTLADLEAELGPLPITTKAVTPSGGIHLYYKYPADIELTNKCNVGEGIDIQADGSQVVVYPSRVYDKEYKWEVSPDVTPPADLPQAWLERLERKRTVSAGGKNFIMPAKIADGNRNVQLTQVAGHIIGSRKFTKSEAIQELARANRKLCTPPLDDEEVITIFESIWGTQETAVMNDYMEKLETIIERKDNLPRITFDTTQDEPRKEAKEESDPMAGVSTWYVVDEKGKSQFYDEQFIMWFVKEQQLTKYDGLIYTQNRELVTDDMISEQITRIIGPLFINGTLQQMVVKLTKLVPLYVKAQAVKVDVNEIHFLNKSFNVKSGELKEIDKKFAITLLQHNYDPDAKCPTWEKYINELLSPEDVRTVKQYMGYCLTPSTRAQVALFICGKGGEGKSRILSVLRNIFGETMYVDKIRNVAEDRFGLAPLQHKLLVVEDDMDMDAITKTDRLKELITTEDTMAFEEKHKGQKNVKLYSRIFALGNGFPRTLYDTSDGWNRRILPVITLPVPTDRKPDPAFSEKLDAETPGIIAWCVEGLLDYINNGQRIFVSESSQEIKKAMVANNGDTLTRFLHSGIVEFTNNPDDLVLQTDFKSAYVEYCLAGGEKPNPGVPARVVQYRQLNNHNPKLANKMQQRLPGSQVMSRIYAGVKLHVKV